MQGVLFGWGNKKPLEHSKGMQTYRNTPVSFIRTITVGWDSHPSCLSARRLSDKSPVYCRWRLSLRPETELFIYNIYYRRICHTCQPPTDILLIISSISSREETAFINSNSALAVIWDGKSNALSTSVRRFTLFG